MDDLHFLSVLKGKRIKLTLKSSSYLGVVQRINPNKTLILADVVSGTHGCKCPGSKMFFGHEIVNVEFINEVNTDSGKIQDHRLEEHLNVEKFQPYRKTFAFDDEEEDNVHFEVIDEFHEKFGPAVMHIKKQHVIGVGADGVEVFRHGRLCWLQIATKNKIYLFDILVLGSRAFKNGLLMILENKHILKVIHDCRAIAGCLISQFGVKLTNVFDTQVADIMCFYSETGGLLPNRVSTLEEVVGLHLKVPSSRLISLQMKSQLTEDEQRMWQKRPCPVPLLKVMALSVVHLHSLRLVLLDTLMIDYVSLVDSYLNNSHFQPDELDHVTMESVLELPRELRKLQEMRTERQEWAADHYPVTEEGLLARFNPITEDPPQTSPVQQQHSQMPGDSIEPATVEPHSSPFVDLPLHNPPMNPLTLAPTAVPGLSEGMSLDIPPRPPGPGRGGTGVLMNTIGRGQLFGNGFSSPPASPATGRGFLLQISQAHGSIGEMETPGGRGAASDRSHTKRQCTIPAPGVMINKKTLWA